MIFSSLGFIFLFLPFSAAGYVLLQKNGYFRLTLFFIFLTSLCYYGYWDYKNIAIILASIAINYSLGQAIQVSKNFKKTLFFLAVTINITILSYFKYTDFAISTINTLFSASLPLTGIILPLGISFFTFQQIAYISDIYTEKLDPTHEGVLSYCCFVAFFPQLIAGPLVHHREMMPQFALRGSPHTRWENIYSGIVVFSIGLAKKVLIADNLSPSVAHCFDAIGSLTFLEACLGSLAYTLQLYFDFSGYADMAIGCGLLFNIHLPQNFLSPYKAKNIQDFWRRWHITLSRWLRDYLYIPLGGNRRGNLRTLGNIFITFLLGGLWHGAGWTFVLWGGMHGAALVAHRLYSQLNFQKLPIVLGWMITFAFVNVAWIVFRAPNFERLGKFWDALLGYNGFYFRQQFKTSIGSIVGNEPHTFTIYIIFMMLTTFLALFAKNSTTILRSIQEKPNTKTTFLTILCIALSIVSLINADVPSEFLYFEF